MIYLASQSPRRKQLLALILPNFTQISSGVEEKEYKNLTSQQKTIRLSKDKCIGAVNKLKEEGMVVIASDTIVSYDGITLEKPKDFDDCVNMISLLSGKTHTVYTAVSVYKNGIMYTFCDSTEVTFKNIPHEDIIKYAHTDEPYDKSGGYAIQGYIGTNYKQSITGSENNVMGLPTEKLKTVLRYIGEI